MIPGKHLRTRPSAGGAPSGGCRFVIFITMLSEIQRDTCLFRRSPERHGCPSAPRSATFLLVEVMPTPPVEERLGKHSREALSRLLLLVPGDAELRRQGLRVKGSRPRWHLFTRHHAAASGSRCPPAPRQAGWKERSLLVVGTPPPSRTRVCPGGPSMYVMLVFPFPQRVHYMGKLVRVKHGTRSCVQIRNNNGWDPGTSLAILPFQQTD